MDETTFTTVDGASEPDQDRDEPAGPAEEAPADAADDEWMPV